MDDQGRISHSEITTYLDCQKKWKLQYVDGIKLTNPHFIFGEMAHRVLETGVIPAEELYPELKEFFGIRSWKNYFTFVMTEIKNFTKDYEIFGRELKVSNKYVKGVIDLVLKKDNKYVLCDYKFSLGIKDWTDLALDEQLYIYAMLFSETYNISLSDIEICYISIPKTEIDEPRVLTNGKLSKDKGQNTTYEKYLAKIRELNLNEEEYKDILDVLKNKEILHIYKNKLDTNTLCSICNNIDNVLKDMKKGYILEKHSYMCKRCPYVDYCKKEKLWT